MAIVYAKKLAKCIKKNLLTYKSRTDQIKPEKMAKKTPKICLRNWPIWVRKIGKEFSSYWSFFLALWQIFMTLIGQLFWQILGVFFALQICQEN